MAVGRFCMIGSGFPLSGSLCELGIRPKIGRPAAKINGLCWRFKRPVVNLGVAKPLPWFPLNSLT
jgi:hypothetical protein